jgi:polyisoprenoid-binding protein YceI
MPNLDDLSPGIWNIDPSHTAVTFVARHLVITKVRGKFGEVNGALTIAGDKLTSSVEATIEMASVTTGDDGRDGHLKSADFFDVETYPNMTFVSTGIRGDGAEYVLTGDLTIKGVSKSAELDLEFEGVSPDPWGATRVGFSATGEINRRDFGLDFDVKLDTGGALVSEKIKIEIEAQAVKS